MKYDVADLRRQADQLIARGEWLAAMRLYVAILHRVPEDCECRLQLADTLARVGRTVEAVGVYRATANLCIDGGFPLMAVVACRAMEALGEPVSALISRFSVVYGPGSSKLADVGARLGARYDGLWVDSKELSRKLTVEELVADAATVGSELDTVSELPLRVSRVPILSDLGPVIIPRVIQALMVHRLPEGHLVFRQGDTAACCYLIAMGKVRFVGHDDRGRPVELATLAAGSIFGEMGMISGAKRTADAEVCEGGADLLEFGSAALVAMGEEIVQLAPALERIAYKRDLQNLLQQSAVFKVFEPEQRQELLKRFAAYEVPENTLLYSQGEACRGIYLLLRGEVAVSRRDDDGSAEKAKLLAAGAMLGVNSVLREAPASATAKTVTPATLLFLSARVVLRLSEAVPEFLAALEEVAEHHAQLINSITQG
jgi:CRP-like cAMP-binding protein